MRNRVFILALMFLLGFNAFCQTATITLTSEKQTIKGYGAINHPVWYGDLNASERELAFGSGDGQIGISVLRIWVSDNSSQWALELPTAKKAIEKGAIVFATPWNPPTGMYTTVNGKKHINTATFAAYAKHLNDFVTYMKNNGVDLYAISVQNEPDYADQWTAWTPQEAVDFIKGYGDQINCRLMTPESFQYRKNVYDPILNDATALSKVDIFGTHLYGTAVADFAYPLFKQKGAGKELWMTEVYTESSNDANIWSLALDAAVHIHNAMVVGEFQTYVWWPLRRFYALIHDGVGGHNNPNVAAAGTVTKRGFVMAQFSRFVRPGYVRVDATSSPTTNVYVSAYKKGDDVVVVAVNKNSTAKTITLAIPGTKVTSWDQYVTSETKNVAKGTKITASTSVQVTLDAMSATTFVGIAPTTTAPLAPTVTSPVTYCQSATATALTATGTALKWYTTATGGTALTAAPTPVTTTAGTTNYYVSQTVNRVESPRALIAVTINATPAAPTVVTPIKYVQNATATALTATGTALKWYSVATNGTALAAAPTPLTTNIGTMSYYVSQTLTSCESARAKIDVVVNATSVTIPLVAGWNWVGCPLAGSTPIATALSSVWSNVLVVKNMDSFYLSSNAAALNSLTQLDWGQGYMVKVSADCSLIWIK